MWNIGSGVRLTVFSSNAQRGEVSAAAARLRCVVSTPFGTPVVPDVYIWTMGTSEAPRPPGSTASRAASHASYAGPVSTTVIGARRPPPGAPAGLAEAGAAVKAGGPGGAAEGPGSAAPPRPLWGGRA